jgi:hypothetical protein
LGKRKINVNFFLPGPTKPPFKRWWLLLLLLAAGCHRDEITVYTVPKEKAGEITAESDGQQPGLGYILPDGWKELTANGMVVLKLAVPGANNGAAEVSAMQFTGKEIPTLKLVNIVRENAGLPAMTEDELNKTTEQVPIGSDKGSLIDLNRAIAKPADHTNSSVMLAVYPHGGITWFFKFDGDVATVSAQKPAFLQFLKSLTFTEGEAPMFDPHKSMGTNAKLPSRAGRGSAPEPETAALPQWKVPPGWQEIQHSPMLRAQFAVAGKDGAKAEVNISVAGGAPIMNVNRWRGQLGLPPAGGDEFAKLVTGLDVQGGKAMLVDMTGTDVKTSRKARLVGVIVPQNNGTWFYKLMGDESVVEAEKPAFVEFVKSVNYSNVN